MSPSLRKRIVEHAAKLREVHPHGSPQHTRAKVMQLAALYGAGLPVLSRSLKRVPT